MPSNPSPIDASARPEINALEISKRLRTAIRSRTSVAEEDLQPETRFVRDLGFDSLDLVETVMTVESEFDLDITDDDASQLASVGDTFSYLCRRLGIPNAPMPDDDCLSMHIAEMSSSQLAWAIAKLTGNGGLSHSCGLSWDRVGPLQSQCKVSVEPQWALGAVNTWSCRAYGPSISGRPSSPDTPGLGEAQEQIDAVAMAIVSLHFGNTLLVPKRLASAP